jgi:hypothetical protein
MAAPPRDAQRNALRDLVALSAESAATEAEIEERHRTQIDRARRQLEKQLAEIEQRVETARQETLTEYDQRATVIAEQSQRAMAELKAHDSAMRQRTEGENEAVVTELKSNLQQAVWLAESVYEGTQAQLAKDYKKAKEDHAAREAEIEDLNNQATALLMWYGQPQLATMPVATPPATPAASDLAAAPPPAGTDVAAAAAQPAPAPSPAPTESYDSLRDDVKRMIAGMENLQVPRLVVGVWPFLITVLVCLLAAAVAQFFAGGIPSDASSVQWKPVGLAAGVALVVCIVGVLLLRMLAHVHVRRTYIPIRQKLELAKRVSRTMVEEARVQRDAKLTRATKKRDLEVHGAKEKLSPFQARAIRNHEAAVAAAKNDYSRRFTRIEETRKRDQSAADQWRDSRLAEIQQQHDSDASAAKQQHDQTVQQSEQQYAQDRDALQSRWNQGLKHIQTPIEQDIHSSNGQLLENWDDPRWQNWSPPKSFPDRIRFGEFQVDLKQITDKYPRQLELPPTFSVPAALMFPRQASMLIHTDHAGRADAIRTQQMLMARLLTQLPPGRVRFTIIDPVGLGQNFAGFMHLADHDEALVGTRIWTEQEHIQQQLANLTEHMETVIQKYLRNEFQTIDEYNAQAGELAEPYRYLIIADFPVGFEADAYRRLNSIASSGARCGVFFIIVRDTRQPLPSGVHLDELESHAINLVRKGNAFSWKDEIFKQFPLAVDAPPGEEFLTRILEVVGSKAKEAKRVEVPFETIAPEPDQIWKGDTKDELQVPIGRLGATRLQLLKLGRGVAQHALIAGKTGSGKSTLLHVLVTNLSLWYSPEQVEFYLVDFKKGVEFKTYATHRLPHARAIAVESDREFGLSVLQRIDAELARRGEMYRKLGVQDLAAYRQASGKPLPRTLLMIDEFQEFFTEDDKISQEASLLLDRLVRQGRAFGIHVLLGSQTIGGTSGLARTTIGQMAVRIALQTSEADSQLILGDTNSAARLLSRPGEAIYNDAGGLVEGNSPFQISWLGDDQREIYLDQIRKKATAEHDQHAEPIVFEGNAPADITRNKRLSKLIESYGAAGMKRPAAPQIWLGDPVAIKEPTSVALREQSGANMMIVGQHEEPAMALMAAAMVSLAAQHPRGAAKFYLLDGTPADSILSGVLPRIVSALPVESKLIDYRAVPEGIAEIAEEVARRQAAEQTDFPSIYVFIYGLQRYRMLRKSEESFSFSSDDADKKPAPDKQLGDILREGPAVRVHVIAWVDTAASIDRTFDRGAMREFDNRVLFQMSAADSSNLIDSPAANKLGYHRAMVYSEELGVMEKFRPYALPPKEWLQMASGKLGA